MSIWNLARYERLAQFSMSDVVLSLGLNFGLHLKHGLATEVDSSNSAWREYMICETINANAKAKEIHNEHPLINRFPIPCLAHHTLFSSLNRADLATQPWPAGRDNLVAYDLAGIFGRMAICGWMIVSKM